MTTSASAESLRPVPPLEHSGDVAMAWKWPAIGAAVLVGIVVFVFWNFFRYQVITAITEQADWGHILVVPIIAGYFVYLNRQKLLAKPFKTTWIGILPVVVGLAWYIECNIGLRALNHRNLQSIGIMMTISGLTLLFLGWRSMLWMWFPLTYWFVFGQKISDRALEIATFKMQDITAQGAHIVMQLIGMEVDRSGNTITVMHNGKANPLNIAEACSGMRMLMAFLALGVAMAYTGLRRYWQRTALVFMALPTAIFINVLRVVTLGILSLADSEFAAGDFHSFIGLVWLVPAFMIYLGLMWIIRHVTVEQEVAVRVAARSSS